MSTDWIKIGTGVAMVLPFVAFMFWIARRDVRDLYVFAQAAIGFVGGVLLLFGLVVLAAHGGLMILEAFR